MLKLYGAPNTRAVRIVWLLEELALPYELILLEFQTTSTEFFIQQTPTGKIPTLEDGAIIMSESGAMVEYILESYGDGRLAPSVQDPQRATFLQWLHFAESTAFTPIGTFAWLTRYRGDAEEHPDLIGDARHRVSTTLGYLARQLGEKPYLLGDEFSAADVMMGFTLAAAASLNLLEDVPELLPYLSRLQARSPFQTAIAKLNATAPTDR